jgi:hypothetical protein
MSRMSDFRERLFSPVGLHAVGFGILAVATLLLGIRVGLDWRATSNSQMDALQTKRVELKMLQVQTAPLRGLDKKVELSRTQIDEFYAKRVPPSWSAVLEQLGALATKAPVRLSRVQYKQSPGSVDLTEIKMDAGVTGEYAGIMHFINGMERSQPFFVIRAMELTGQQNGLVNLRLVVSTWLRPADAAASGIPVEGEPAATTEPAAAPSGEGQ